MHLFTTHMRTRNVDTGSGLKATKMRRNESMTENANEITTAREQRTGDGYIITINLLYG